MPIKRVLVLANSWKHQLRCVAGREVIDVGAGKYKLGRWVRPVAGSGRGELNLAERSQTNDREAQVFDFVEMPLAAPVGDPLQPENWTIVGPRSWRNVNQEYQRPVATFFLETPPDLWLRCPAEHALQPQAAANRRPMGHARAGAVRLSEAPSGARTDRLAHSLLLDRPPTASLYVIRPEEFRLCLTVMGGKDKRRAAFRYHGVEYNLAVTDPRIGAEYFVLRPKPGEFRLRCGDKCLICVSLAGDFDGFHYKVIATIFEDA
jgi:hypothetical protein